MDRHHNTFFHQEHNMVHLLDIIGLDDEKHKHRDIDMLKGSDNSKYKMFV